MTKNFAIFLGTALSLAVATTASSAASLCDDGSALTFAKDGITLKAATEPAKVRVSEPFSLKVEICDGPDGFVVQRIDATMPAHGHGMNYSPELSVTGDGTYASDNMVFHMPGRWQFMVDVGKGTESERLMADYTLTP